MRTLIILFAFILTIEANNILWFSNFDLAHHEAVKNSKKLMVLLIEKNPTQNKNTLINVFMNQDYIDEINEEYISVLITKDQDSSYPIEMLYTNEYPSLFFLNNLEIYICEPIRGGITSDRLKAHLVKCK